MPDNSTKSKSKIIVWILTVIVSIVLLFLGNYIMSKDLDIFSEDGVCCKAKITKMGSYVSDSHDVGAEQNFEDYIQYFYAKILTGSEKGETVLAAQTSDNYTYYYEEPVQLGDKVIIYNYGTKAGEADWVFGGYSRLGGVMWLSAAFFALLLFFGRAKGLNTMLSLSFTCLAVFAVFVPSILAGYNIYLMTGLTCVYTIVMTLLLTNGATQKSFTTIMGCSFGVAVAAILEIVFNKILRLTGMTDEHSIYLSQLPSGVEIDLHALVFSMIVIGAMGAVMDVAMDISSSLYEVHAHAKHIGFKELFMSGIRIGRDVMGTMANTLVLAYIGSSLCGILLLITYSSSLMELLNRENIIVELLQAMIGSLSILLTMPITSMVCAALYTDRSGSAEKGVIGVIADSSKEDYLPKAAEFVSKKDKSAKKSVFAKRKQKTTQPVNAPKEEYKSIIPKDEPVFFYYNEDNNKK